LVKIRAVLGVCGCHFSMISGGPLGVRVGVAAGSVVVAGGVLAGVLITVL